MLTILTKQFELITPTAQQKIFFPTVIKNAAGGNQACHALGIEKVSSYNKNEGFLHIKKKKVEPKKSKTEMSIANITVDACDNAQKDRHEETANQTRFVLIEDRMR